MRRKIRDEFNYNTGKLSRRTHRLIFAYAIILIVCFAGAFLILTLTEKNENEEKNATATDAAASDADAAQETSRRVLTSDGSGFSAVTSQGVADITEESESENSGMRDYATDGEKLSVLDGIIAYRADHGYENIIAELDDELTAQAQEWAEYLTENDLTEHSETGNGIIESIHKGTVSGEANIIGADETAWYAIGRVASINTSIYKCDRFGIGVAVTEDGYSIIVILGAKQISSE